MNSWKFNSNAQYYLRVAIAKKFKIDLNQVYAIVKRIIGDRVELHDGRKFKISLEEIDA